MVIRLMCVPVLNCTARYIYVQTSQFQEYVFVTGKISDIDLKDQTGLEL